MPTEPGRPGPAGGADRSGGADPAGGVEAAGGAEAAGPGAAGGAGPVGGPAPAGGSARVLLVVALGGGLGGLARYAFAGLGTAGTIAVNVLGSALIGVLMVLVPRLHPLARPFLGVGVLGGFTTFSAYALDAVRLGGLRAAAYLLAVVVLAVAATALGAAVTRRVLR
ncbi:fluoride efflux transporter FluC [Saccharothrix australiensis]|uniref:Fluoride-specific ion channel FluC n=1 Tax=Saccharothrix australiensis TaxID=2072 RepID=A0A495VUX2_9PSEU|nr:CrcB family protein [Saccharothrix australiensis]RKT53221.1 fluoride ion exporter CrcB/FEX [Saccharothrix australiensis]